MEEKKRNEIMFTQIVLMFHTAAMQQLGKLKNPLTDALERNLEAAQNSIDLLDMLKEKTRGNLSAEESRLLSQVIQELKLNYVDEAAKPEPPAEKESTS
jgi:uncharacterized protein YeeX (DUF496 family)